jgi:hypothetical protein
MTAVKIAISLPPETLASARKAVRDGHAPSVSAFVAQAIDQLAERDSLLAFVRDLLADSGGPPTAAERARARKDLGLSDRASTKPGKRVRSRAR